MPQMDKITFISIIFWVTILYVFQYLLLSVSHMYIFVNFFKLKSKRILYNIFYAKLVKRQLRVLLFFPWIFDFDEDEYF